MKPEVAIKVLVNATYSDEWQGNEDVTTAQHMAVDALEKQIPRTVKHNETELMCPRCNLTFDVDEIEMPYCWRCAQKLSWYWSDEE